MIARQKGHFLKLFAIDVEANVAFRGFEVVGAVGGVAHREGLVF